jgi:hypothetical protein
MIPRCVLTLQAAPVEVPLSFLVPVEYGGAIIGQVCCLQMNNALNLMNIL